MKLTQERECIRLTCALRSDFVIWNNYPDNDIHVLYKWPVSSKPIDWHDLLFNSTSAT